MPVRGVLFDLDDTLFDHEHATLTALTALGAEEPAFGAWPADELARRHGEVLEAMHVEVLAGLRSIDSARAERFRRLLVEAGGDASAARASHLAGRYRASYETAWQAVPGAAVLLESLRAEGLAIAIVTNNMTAEQTLKLRRCGLDVLIDTLVTSEDVGAAKPETRIFAAALDRLGLEARDAVMVGDAWGTDIAGALAAGIRPVWFNRRARPTPDAAVPQLRSLAPVDHAARVIRGVTPATPPIAPAR